MADDLFGSPAAGEGQEGGFEGFDGSAGFASAPAPTADSGFTFIAADAPTNNVQDAFGGEEQPAEFGSTAAPWTGGASGGAAATSAFSGFSAAVPAESASPLVEFNKQFRETNEAKDAAERTAKGARKAEGRTASKAMLAERAAIVDQRKAKNRGDEVDKRSEAAAGVSGEPWQRVNKLIDVHATSASVGGGAASEGGSHHKKKSSGEVAIGDVSRMKDVLIAVKNAPPATSPTAQ